MTYRYMQLVINANNGDSYMSIAELEFRETAGGVDVTTPTSPITATSEVAPSEGVAGLIDNNYEGFGWTAASPIVYPQIITVDLGTSRDIRELYIKVPTGRQTRGPRNFVIRGSNTGMTATDFIDIQTFTGIGNWDLGPQLFALPVTASTVPTVRLINRVFLTESGTAPDYVYTGTDNGTASPLGGHGIGDYNFPGDGVVTFKVGAIISSGRMYIGLTANSSATAFADLAVGVGIRADGYNVAVGGVDYSFGAPPPPATGDLIRFTRIGATFDVSISKDNGATFPVIWHLDPVAGSTLYPFYLPVFNGSVSSLSGTGGVSTAAASAPAPTPTPPPAPAPTPTPTSGTTIKTVGAGKDFPTLSAAANYVNGLNPVTLQQKIVIEVYENQNVNGITFFPLGSSADYFVTVRPAAGLGINTINASGPFDFSNTSGIVLTGGSDNFTVGTGTLLDGFDIDLLDIPAVIGRNYFGALATASNGYGAGGSYSSRFANCRIRAQSQNNNLFLGGYGVSTYFDNCLIIQETTYNKLFYAAGGPIVLNGCAVVRRNGAGTGKLWSAESMSVENTFIIGGGSQLSDTLNNYISARNNVVDTAITTGSVIDSQGNAPIGFTAASNFVVNALNDYTPAANGALIGKGGFHVISTNDIRGNNRGVAPDVGPIQLTPALPLAKGTVTSQVLDGASLVISGTTEGTVDSGLITLQAATPGNGAQGYGPLPITLGQGTFTVTVDNIASGDYLSPQISLTNNGGTAMVNGAAPFTMMGIGSLVYDTGGVGTGGGGTPPVTTLPAPTVGISTADNKVLTGKTATISGPVNLQGAADGVVNVFADPQPSGAPVALGAANVLNGIWTKQAPLDAGLYKLRVVATANNQTATASTGNLRILGLTGTVNMPVA